VSREGAPSLAAASAHGVPHALYGAQPPILIIGRLLLRAMPCMPSFPPWAKCFARTARPITHAMYSSEAPTRMRSRSETSSLPKRHTLMFPSAVSRRRLQLPQKCSVIDVMKPTWPLPPGTPHALDVSFGLSRDPRRQKSGKRALITSSISAYGTSL
jgi:hypothetical protein